MLVQGTSKVLQEKHYRAQLEAHGNEISMLGWDGCHPSPLSRWVPLCPPSTQHSPLLTRHSINTIHPLQPFSVPPGLTGLLLLQVKGMLGRGSQPGAVWALLGALPAAWPALAMPANTVRAASTVHLVDMVAFLLGSPLHHHQFHTFILMVRQHRPLARDCVDSWLRSLAWHLLCLLLREAPLKLAVWDDGEPALVLCCLLHLRGVLLSNVGVC